MVKMLVQTLIAMAVFQMFPYDAGVMERHAVLPDAASRVSPGLSETLELSQKTLPPAPDAARQPVKVQKTSMGVVTSAVSALVIDRVTGSVLFEKNSGVSRSIGSMTKLMTAYVFLQSDPDLQAPAEIQPSDVRLGGVQHLRAGDQVTVRDLLYASLVGSDNSATAALARLSGLSPGDFVARMNEVAADIGMRNTTFVDPAGLSPDNRSVATDLVRLLDQTMKDEVIRAATELPVASVTSVSGKTYRIENTNDLLHSFLNQPPFQMTGGKTGFLPEAGYCFGAVIAEHGAHEITVVVLGSDSEHGRFQDAKALAAWAYKAYDWPDEI